ncbi:hypothetical protein CsatB_008413 [Cannabis sativa]
MFLNLVQVHCPLLLRNPKKKSIKESKPKLVAQTSSKPSKQKFKVVVSAGEPSSGDARKAKRKRIDNDDDFVSVRPRKQALSSINGCSVFFFSRTRMLKVLKKLNHILCNLDYTYRI